MMVKCTSIAAHPFELFATLCGSFGVCLLHNIRGKVGLVTVFSVIMVFIYQPLVEIIKIL